MWCSGCFNGSKSYSIGVCRVCELVKDDSVKKPVKYCKLCGANICNYCTWDERIIAATIEKKKKITDFVKNYVK